jgi:methylated-DNA-[protein]-cysteine S-methyltransferase
MTFQYKHVGSPLGQILIAASDDGIKGLWFENQLHHPDTTGWQAVRSQKWLDQCASEIQSYFEGTLREFKSPLSIPWGTEFQQSVWRELQLIPFGQTTSYGELAMRINNPQAVRAVGAAIGKNPWSIIVPCHRIIGANGSLTGYAGGLERKTSLLRLEKAPLQR